VNLSEAQESTSKNSTSEIKIQQVLLKDAVTPIPLGHLFKGTTGENPTAEDIAKQIEKQFAELVIYLPNSDK